ncbi:hypothetical protein DFH11DRAFT_1612376 [Phellopilus nigrolimitatus]|nr:hypothetical protein DFH11DRAFT_1612376 [Phellopilus nigrolimitatus]
MPRVREIANVIALLGNLAGTCYASQAVLSPLYGKTFGPIYFYFGTFVSFLFCSSIFPDATRQQRRALKIVSLVQVATAVCARFLGAFTALHIENPMLAALAVHSLLSFPMIGLEGAVWLQWTKKFMDQESTKIGQIIIGIFTCVALASIMNFAEPFLGNIILEFTNFSPNATFICLAMATYTLSNVFNPELAVSKTRYLSSMITVISLFVVMLAITVPPYTPGSITILYQRYTALGLVQVADSHFSASATRYLRLDASMLGIAKLSSDGVLGDTIGESNALQDAARLVQSTKGKRALIIGVRTGASAKSLISHSYNTTVVDENRAVYDVARTYFGLPDPNTVFIEDPAFWVQRYAARTASTDGARFDVIVHDVFEGGELPAKLFTMEFWAVAKGLLDSRGVISVRYVGNSNSVTLKSTLNMLQKTFTTCRAYRSGSYDQKSPLEITELVIFCTPSESLTFRRPIEADFAFASSAQHKDVLTALDKYEMDISAVLGETSPERFLLREADPVMSRWGRESINVYWKLMRQRFPATVWSSY